MCVVCQRVPVCLCVFMCMFVCVGVCVIVCHCVRRSLAVIVYERALGSIHLSHIGSKPYTFLVISSVVYSV